MDIVVVMNGNAILPADQILDAEFAILFRPVLERQPVLEDYRVLDKPMRGWSIQFLNCRPARKRHIQLLLDCRFKPIVDAGLVQGLDERRAFRRRHIG